MDVFFDLILPFAICVSGLQLFFLFCVFEMLPLISEALFVTEFLLVLGRCLCYLLLIQWVFPNLTNQIYMYVYIFICSKVEVG